MSSRDHVRTMENELRHYWRLNQLGRGLARIEPVDPLMDELHDEMEVLADMTDWPLLKAAAHRCLKLDDERQTKRAGAKC